MKISYAITVCNEFIEIQNLIPFLLEHKRKDDEIVVLYDSTNGDPEIEEYLRAKSVNPSFAWYSGEFKNHFADWKNYLTSLCKGNWIFQIDADEMPNELLITNLHKILIENPNNDVYLVPRVNTVEGLTDEYIKKWNWTVNGKGCEIYGSLPPMEDLALYHPKEIERQVKQNNYYSTL
jgi:hypothetical protein